ncbi:hypothetical protein [Psychroserpens sp. SPM9]|uniref:hypothetical protein n=1 Tax=Psychroserpens sp. SPM9 TaxID=2975598 RepID=UPI0021A40142|nr:hypothetical protein [Psychroserpens sp. SPM9]MDG5491628.1 hypothetical protein [Psychroserpens sp. SPM9]
MKRSLLFLFAFCSLNLFAQEDDQLHYLDLVESYYDKQTKQPLFIYDRMNGKIIDTLHNIDDKHAWYKIAILDSDYGWFKIKNIQRLPGSYKNYDHENHWVRSTNFLISVDVYGENHRAYLYDEPRKSSNKIHKIDSFKRVNVLETNDLWAKVSFVVAKKEVIGWLSFKDQCAYPWTTCPKYDE